MHARSYRRATVAVVVAACKCQLYCGRASAKELRSLAPFLGKSSRVRPSSRTIFFGSHRLVLAHRLSPSPPTLSALACLCHSLHHRPEAHSLTHHTPSKLAVETIPLASTESHPQRNLRTPFMS